MMDINQYGNRMDEIDKEYYEKIDNLNKEYIKDNAKFKIGDFIYNVTGIIKVEYIGLGISGNKPCIEYSGYKYRKEKGILYLTKTFNKYMTKLSNSLSLMDGIEYEDGKTI
jgi:hypothetical protein